MTSWKSLMTKSCLEDEDDDSDDDGSKLLMMSPRSSKTKQKKLTRLTPRKLKILPRVLKNRLKTLLLKTALKNNGDSRKELLFHR